MAKMRRRLLHAALALPALAAARHVVAAESAGAPKALRILILGGTGFTGPEQVDYALARGHRVTLFNLSLIHI